MVVPGGYSNLHCKSDSVGIDITIIEGSIFINSNKMN